MSPRSVGDKAVSDEKPAPGASCASKGASLKKAARPRRRRLVIVLLILGALTVR